MKIDPQTAALSLHGLTLSTGTDLNVLRASQPADFESPIISNCIFKTYRLADNEAATHLVFRNGWLWQVRTSLLILEDATGHLSNNAEHVRHARHELVMRDLLGGTSLRCSNGSSVELCFDERSFASVIVATYPIPDSLPKTQRA